MLLRSLAHSAWPSYWVINIARKRGGLQVAANIKFIISRTTMYILTLAAIQNLLSYQLGHVEPLQSINLSGKAIYCCNAW